MCREHGQKVVGRCDHAFLDAAIRVTRGELAIENGMATRVGGAGSGEVLAEARCLPPAAALLRPKGMPEALVTREVTSPPPPDSGLDFCDLRLPSDTGAYSCA